MEEIYRRQQIEEAIANLSQINLKERAKQDELGQLVAARREREQAARERLNKLLEKHTDTTEAQLIEACAAAKRRVGESEEMVRALRERLQRFESEPDAQQRELDEMRDEAVRLREDALAAASAAVHSADEARGEAASSLEKAWGTDEEEAFVCDYLNGLYEQVRRRLVGARGVAAELAEKRACLASLVKAVDAVAARVDELDVPPPAAGPPGGRLVVFAPLSTDAEARVARALGSGDAGEKLVDFRSIPVYRKDMRTLRPSQWLNDEVINCFFKLLEARAESDAEDLSGGKLKIHFMNTQFYHKLAGWSDGGYLYKNVARWTRRVDIFAKDIVIVPIHCHGNHWSLALINFVQRRVQYIDSLHYGDGGVLENLRRYVEDEHMHKKQASYDTSGWELLSHRGDIPKQHNGVDCGVFMCTNANLIARGAALTYTQAELPYLRRRMVFELLQNELLDV